MAANDPAMQQAKAISHGIQHLALIIPVSAPEGLWWCYIISRGPFY